jgi:hypothetical protein
MVTPSTNLVRLAEARDTDVDLTRPLPEPRSSAAPPRPPRIGFSEFDQRAITALTSGDPNALLEHARGLAEALTGADASGCRRRTISRALAICRSQEEALEAILGEALGRRDFAAVAAIDKLLARLTKRLEMLLREHRLETQQQRPAVVVGINANTVNLGAGGEGR